MNMTEREIFGVTMGLEIGIDMKERVIGRDYDQSNNKVSV